MKFTIITGPGRCGTSALTEFFIGTKSFRVDSSGYNKKARAGYESDYANLINAYANAGKVIPSYLERRDLLRLNHHTYHNFDIVKSPSFFYFQTYDYWKHEMNKRTHEIQVLLLYRPFEEVLESSSRVNIKKDWSQQTVETLKKKWDENIFMLDKLEISYTILEFPKFTTDITYLYNKLQSVDLGNFDKSYENILKYANSTFKSKI